MNVGPKQRLGDVWLPRPSLSAFLFSTRQFSSLSYWSIRRLCVNEKKGRGTGEQRMDRFSAPTWRVALCFRAVHKLHSLTQQPLLSPALVFGREKHKKSINLAAWETKNGLSLALMHVVAVDKRREHGRCAVRKLCMIPMAQSKGKPHSYFISLCFFLSALRVVIKDGCMALSGELNGSQTVIW